MAIDHKTKALVREFQIDVHGKRQTADEVFDFTALL